MKQAALIGSPAPVPPVRAPGALPSGASGASTPASIALAIALASVAGCGGEPTEIVLVVDTDIESPDPLATIVIDAQSTTTPALRFELPLGAATTPPFPLTLTLTPRTTTEVEVIVTVRGLDETGTTIVARDVRTRFVPGGSRMLRVLLAERCVGVRCPIGETCDERGCRAIAIPPEELPGWPGSPPGLEGSACEEEPEACNYQDDDCDGTIDEGLDLDLLADHCGYCGHACGATDCTLGYCEGERPAQLSVGGAHACARRESGRVVCWGWNLQGQAGAGPELRWIPGDLALAMGGALTEGVDEVSAGSAHTCLRIAGAVRCFGNGTSGELGNGAFVDAVTPVEVSMLSGATAISAGAAHTCAIAAGAVMCWGRNEAGQLGDGTTMDRATPGMVMGVAMATTVSTGLRHSCATTMGGEVWCWGANESGQLGDGTTMTSPMPVQVMGISDAVSVAVGRRHGCALRMGGAISCWGANESAQLGDGTTNRSLTPVAVVMVPAASQLSMASAGTHGCAVTTAGAVWCWGSNLAGQLGDGTTMTRLEPIEVPMLSDLEAIGAGGHADDGGGHTCALLATGAVHCWGEGTLGRLGNASETESPSPAPVIGLPY